MLNREQLELIQREFDDANTPEEGKAFRSLMEVEPPAHLRRAILESLPLPARTSPHPFVRWIRSQWSLLTAFMEETFMTRKTMIYGGAALAIVLVIASVVTDFPPLRGTAGTIGGNPAGVQQASRYRGRTMTSADVTLDNPEIKALLQNDRILRLVQSEAFRELMENEAFRSLQQSEEYRALQESEAFRDLQQSEEYRALQESDASRAVLSTEAYRELAESEAYREVMESEAYRELMESEAYHDVMETEAFRALFMSDAFRLLQESEAFRAIARDAQMSEAFMTEAARVAP